MNNSVTYKHHKGFTLIELIAVIVVLAILSAVAVPKYFDYADQAKTAALQGSLGGIRSAISSYYADQSITGKAKYPTRRELDKVGTVMQQELPKNPYNNKNTVKKITDPASARARKADGSTGWAYFFDNKSTPPVAIFWANSTDKTTATGGRSGNTILRANKL